MSYHPARPYLLNIRLSLSSSVIVALSTYSFRCHYSLDSLLWLTSCRDYSRSWLIHCCPSYLLCHRVFTIVIVIIDWQLCLSCLLMIHILGSRDALTFTSPAVTMHCTGHVIPHDGCYYCMISSTLTFLADSDSRLLSCWSCSLWLCWLLRSMLKIDAYNRSPVSAYHSCDHLAAHLPRVIHGCSSHAPHLVFVLARGISSSVVFLSSVNGTPVLVPALCVGHLISPVLLALSTVHLLWSATLLLH
jgi:hypothetical protein